MTVLTAVTSPATSSSLDPTVLLTWLTCLVTLSGLIITVLKYGRRIMQMVEDFNGEPERPGVPAKPGVMERLQTLDAQVAVVHAEVNYNHGGSIKDVVDRIEGDVKSIHERLDANVQGP
jgi:hypothetical protein